MDFVGSKNSLISINTNYKTNPLSCLRLTSTFSFFIPKQTNLSKKQRTQHKQRTQNTHSTPSLGLFFDLEFLRLMGRATAESQFHVLAVDDSLLDRKLIERLLKTKSYQVTTVESGSKALEFLGLNEDGQSNPNSWSVSPNNNQAVEVNLVITDYCMPGMTGYDLLKKIKESSSLKDIPVVIMSSENVPSRITRCLEEGAEEFFLKPVKVSDLNKLNYHMMRTETENKTREEIQEKQAGSEKADIGTQQQQKQSQTTSVVAPTTPAPPQQQQQQPNKRKAIEEGLSADRTRPRYDGITTMV